MLLVIHQSASVASKLTFGVILVSRADDKVCESTGITITHPGSIAPNRQCTQRICVHRTDENEAPPRTRPGRLCTAVRALPTDNAQLIVVGVLHPDNI